MTDRELLEAAAKAAGLRWQWVDCPKYKGKVPGVYHKDAVNETVYWLPWNPLQDDGDALRLAVDLEFCVGLTRRPAQQLFYASAGKYGEYREDVKNGDPYAATRRAIVRAAAAMAT